MPHVDSPDDDDLADAFSALSVGPPESGKLYAVQKEGYTQVTTHWGEARYEQQHNGAQVIAKTVAAAYVVFVGRQIGVFRTWAECRAATSRYSGAIYQGYIT
ncbi:hypothetical protein BDZ89DRAFT_1152112 [Hymenopellis radicata]|nr:hypothetical protein BDZ89DRAFT_1152112 [Hymenopellis radicata]